MFRDLRASNRIPCQGSAELQFQDHQATCEVANLSRGGACLLVALDTWAWLEEIDDLEGRVDVDGEAFTFEARICWSSMEGEKVRFGVEFRNCDREILDRVYERLSIVDEEPEDGSFNL